MLGLNYQSNPIWEVVLFKSGILRAFLILNLLKLGNILKLANIPSFSTM